MQFIGEPAAVGVAATFLAQACYYLPVAIIAAFRVAGGRHRADAQDVAEFPESQLALTSTTGKLLAVAVATTFSSRDMQPGPQFRRRLGSYVS